MRVIRLLLIILLVTSSYLLSADDTLLETGHNETILTTIHSDEVRNIMQRLKILIYNREYTELEFRELSNKQIKRLAEVANSLTQIAANLPNIDSLKSLSEEDQMAFNAMANQLHDITQELKQESEANHSKAVDMAYEKLYKTCNTCHKLFRHR